MSVYIIKRAYKYRIIGEIVEYPYSTDIFTYNGDLHVPTWENYNEEIMKMEGEYSSTEAGVHTVTFTLKDGYTWPDGSVGVYNAKWEIKPQEVNIPYQSGYLIYSANTQAPVWQDYDSNKMSIAGVTSAINAGTYVAVFKLKNSNYIWSDGIISKQNVEWEISKKSVSATLSESTISLSLGSSKSITVTAAIISGDASAYFKNKGGLYDFYEYFDVKSTPAGQRQQIVTFTLTSEPPNHISGVIYIGMDNYRFSNGITSSGLLEITASIT